jgi:hypothetical protein
MFDLLYPDFAVDVQIPDSVLQVLQLRKHLPSLSISQHSLA